MMPDVNALWPPNGAGSDGGDDDTDEYDSDSSVTTINSDRIGDYFTVRHGRRFHSHGNSPYPLPSDGIEMERLRGEHDGFSLLMNGSIFFGPVNQVLANDQERRKRVLDLCTGQGVWVVQMAPRYPHVKFYGVDIVPLATRYPPLNAQFEVHDVTEPLRWPDRSIDMVHVRNALLGIRDYPRLVREVARVLRPGGLFLSREWALGIYMADGSSVAYAAPGAHAFYQCISGVLQQRGIFSRGHEIPGYLHHSGRFTQINARAQQIMLGDVDDDQSLTDLGIQFRNLTLQWGNAMRGMLLDSGRTAANVDALLGAFSHDVQNVQGLKVVSYIVHARRNNFV
ncbi:S-adenosyl-L-methionine-dependent methyltransferase [Rickenella mellea]|uniref:S-adenosyl-L-methionine-dependent methyltransferase n=1 Tax=Rickenella mellea TaxID=50990 RepID=A0A4Y7QHF0_9AGAM|nr:S-adenosyl-L-methionine-dependent methyltransferase [Rickenella mellea]